MSSLALIKKGPVCFYGLGRETMALVRYLVRNDLLKEVAYYDASEVALQEISVPYKKINPTDFLKYKVIFKSPGISLYQDVLKEATAKGAVILSPSQLFFEIHPAKKICVTGSKGKSTFCSLLGDLLKSFGVNGAVAGNIGLPLMELIERDLDVVVAELSSYQLASLQFKGHLGVITSLFPEHLTWHLSEAQYYSDKLRIAKSCSKTLVFSAETFEAIRRVDSELPIELLDTSSLPSINFGQGYFKSPHMLQLAKAAIMTLCVHMNKCPADLSADEIVTLEECLKSFKPLRHRLEVFLSSQNFMAVDDSISTAPQAVIAALNSFNPEDEIHLFVGGDDRGVSQEPLLQFLKGKKTVSLHCYSKTGLKVHEHLEGGRTDYSPTLESSIETNKEKLLAPFNGKKRVLLLSPGAPSHDQFKSFEERGELFKELIRKLFSDSNGSA